MWQERVRAATAPVVACAHGQPADAKVLGSAVLLGGRAFMTCLHVVRGRASVDLLVNGERVHACVRGPGDDSVDLAALDLDEALPGVAPLRVSPRRRRPALVAIFGYPAADRSKAGVWLRFREAGPTNDNDVQMSTLDRRGSWRGHSGAPVVDVRDGYVVGLLRSAEREGTFDRYVPLDLAGGAGFELDQGWLYMDVADGWAGRDPAQTVLAAQTVPHSRHGLLDRIAAFVTEGDAAAPLLVTGPPGAGKSWLLRQSAAQLSNVETLFFFDARQATHKHFADAVADMLGFDADQLHGSMPARAGPSALLVDSLDEAATPADARNIGYRLRRLAQAHGLAVVVGARRQPTTGVVRLPQLLGVAAHEAELVIDLGSAAHSAVGDMVPPVADLLAAGGEGTVGAELAGRREVRTRLADVVARRSGGNYLIATTAARLLAGLPADDVAVFDPSNDGFDPRVIPASLDDAIDLAIEGHCARSNADEFAVRGWLAALAYGQGAGLDWSRWVRFAQALGYPMTRADVDRLQGWAISALLTVDPDGRTALFHTTVARQLLQARPVGDDQGRIAAELMRDVAAGGGWARAEQYERRFAAVHARAGGALEDLLLTPGYGEVAEVQPLLSAAEGFACGKRATSVLEVLRQLTGRDEQTGRGALLELAALHVGADLEFVGADACAVRARWANTVVRRRRSLPTHPERVVSIDARTVRRQDGNLHELIATACQDGRVRVWDAGDMTPVGEFDLSPAQPVGVHLTGSVPRLGPVLVILDNTYGIWLAHPWDEAAYRLTVEVFPTPRPDSRTWVARIVPGDDPGAMTVVWGQAENEYETRFTAFDIATDDWSFTAGVLGASPILMKGEGIGLWPYGGGQLSARQVAAVSNPLLSEFLLLDLADASTVGRIPMGELGEHRAVRESRTVLCGRTAAGEVAVIGNKRGEIEIRPAVPGDEGLTFPGPSTVSFTGHFGPVRDLALMTLGGSPALLSAGEDGAVHAWDLNDRISGRRPTRFSGAITSVCLASGPDDALTILAADTSGNFGAADAEHGTYRHFLAARHEGEVTGVAVADLPAAGATRTLAITCSTDTLIRLFDLATGQDVGRPFGGIVHYGQSSCQMTAVAAGRLAGRSVVVAAATGYYLRHHYNSVYVFATEDWTDTGGRESLTEPLFGNVSGHRKAIPCVALAVIGGRDVIVTGSLDGHVRVWDGESFDRIGQPLTAGSAVYDLWTGELLGRTVLLAACGDGRLRMWDAETLTPLAEPLAAHDRAVRGVAVAESAEGPLVVTTGLDSTVRTWNPDGWTPHGAAHPLLFPGTALDCAGSAVVVASGTALVRFNLNTPSGQ